MNEPDKSNILTNLLAGFSAKAASEPDLIDLLTPIQAKRAVEGARSLAKRAAQQHTEAVEWSRDRLKPYADIGERLVVLTREDSDELDDDTMCHVTTLTEEDVDGAVVDHHIEIVTTTQLEFDGKSISYHTRVRTLVEDLLVDLLPPGMQPRVGAVIG